MPPPSRMTRRFLLGLCAAVIGSFALASPAAADQPVTVFAAASLKNALDAAADAWSEASGHAVRITYAGSSALARQIEHGAPADLFLSANVKWMDYLEKEGLIEPESRRDLLGNSLVLVAPKASTQSLAISPELDLAAALDGGRLAVANTAAVPAGLYARQALTSLGLWKGVKPHLAEAQDVRAALALVARAEAPLGIVYATDANAEPGVKVLDTFPSASHDPIIYPAALVRPAGNENAAALLRFLASEAAATHFRAQGFTVLR